MEATAHSPHDRTAALLAALAGGPGGVKDLVRLPEYGHLKNDAVRAVSVRNDLGWLIADGEVLVDPASGRRPAVYRLPGDGSAEEDTVLDVEPGPYRPADVWTLDELLCWLAQAEERPAAFGMAAAFERNRDKAVAAVRRAIDERDRRLKGEL